MILSVRLFLIYEHKHSPTSRGYVDGGKVQVKGYQYAVCMNNYDDNICKVTDNLEIICISIRGRFVSITNT